jgi:hypothetical protein
MFDEGTHSELFQHRFGLKHVSQGNRAMRKE